MKVGLAQITTLPGKISENTAKILEFIKTAKERGAELVIFPELTVPGYSVMDLAFSRSYVEENKRALDEIARHTKGLSVIAGFIDFESEKRRAGNRLQLYNSAAVFDDGRLIGIQDKTLLPNYDIFYEERYFSPARKSYIFSLNGKKVGVQICEDLWDQDYPVKVAEELVKKGAELIVNISASPYNFGKLSERHSLISKLAAKIKLPFFYTNLVGGFDGFEGEVVFDGNSLAYNSQGQLILQAEAFKEGLFLTDLDDAKPVNLKLRSEVEECYDALILGIRDFFLRLGFKRAFVGLSGGIDSSLVAALLREALGAENVTAVTMPSHITSKETLEDSRKLALNLGIKLEERSISPEYNAWLSEFKARFGREPSTITAQNKQARIRGTILMEYANEQGGLVISTGNKTELALGYCTLYGDMCGALAAISDLSKLRVYAISEYINTKAGREIIPASVIKRIPTAELEVGQTDRANLPADYPVVSPLIDKIIEENPALEELYKEYSKEVVDKTIKLINQNEFKRRQAPPGIRVTRRAFGIGRRYPMGL